MEENEARETRTYTIPFRRTKEVSVLAADGIIRFGFVAMVLPVHIHIHMLVSARVWRDKQIAMPGAVVIWE